MVLTGDGAGFVGSLQDSLPRSMEAMVNISRTRALIPSASSRGGGFQGLLYHDAQAVRVTSLPSRAVTALPMVKVEPSS